MEISTSILSVKEEKSIEAFYKIEVAHTDYFHIDVMDGKFVSKNTTQLMEKYIDELENITNTPIEVHLMVQNVKEYADRFSASDPSQILFHIEAMKSKEETMKTIKYIKENCKVGIVLNPETKVEEIYDYLPLIHTVLVMTVHPGKGGQDMIPESIEKIKKLSEYVKSQGLETEIEADGGINIDTIKKIKEAGANIAVVGSYLINSKDYKYTMNQLKNA